MGRDPNPALQSLSGFPLIAVLLDVKIPRVALRSLGHLCRLPLPLLAAVSLPHSTS